MKNSLGARVVTIAAALLLSGCVAAPLAVLGAQVVGTELFFTTAQGGSHTITGKMLGLQSGVDQEACVRRLLAANQGVNNDEFQRRVNRPVADGGCLP